MSISPPEHKRFRGQGNLVQPVEQLGQVLDNENFSLSFSFLPMILTARPTVSHR